MAKRKEAWALLRYLSHLQHLTWLCMGDFNEIVDLTEKRGVVTKAREQMEDFQRTLKDCYLSDLGFSRPKFTWNNGWHNKGFSQERLDRVVANKEWCVLYEVVDIVVLVGRSSNHHPVLISFSSNDTSRAKKYRPFQVEASWSKHAEYRDVVQ